MFDRKIKERGEKMNLDEIYFKDNFTKEGEKVNLEINKLEAECITSKNNKFHLDDEGNLKVNSITTIEPIITEIVTDILYPVGSIYMNVNEMNPNLILGGTWEQIKGRFLLASGDNGDGKNYALNSTGGKASLRLSAAIGACNNDAASLGYMIDGRTGLQNNNDAFYVVNGTGVVKFNNWNHSTPVTEHDDPDRYTKIMPPYLVVSVWKRVA